MSAWSDQLEAIFWHSFGHIFWHDFCFFWHSSWHVLHILSVISFDISSNIVSDISFKILSDISSNISSNILSDISFDISSSILSNISFDFFWYIFWHSSDILSNISFDILGRPHLEDSVLEAFQTPKMRVAKVSQVVWPVTEEFVIGTSWSKHLRRRWPWRISKASCY